jgi:cytochrome P450
MKPSIDLISPEAFHQGHPWAQYAWLRAHAPVYRHAQDGTAGFWAITKYEDVRTISRQPKLFSSSAKGVMVGEPTEEELAPSRQMMLFMDPPQHDRFKALVSRGFTPKRAQLLAGRIAELARQIVDDVVERGECDLVADVAGRLPSALIAELMGIPREDGEHLYELTEIMHTTDEQVHSVEDRLQAVAEMLGYAADVVERKRRAPADDIASALVQAEIDGDRLTAGELQFFFLLLVNAGGDTTRNLVAAGMQQLFDHPDERARLVADMEGLMPTAVEEMLRYTSPVANFQRTLMEDTTVRGVELLAGDRVVLFYGSANRDEDAFAAPDRFDIGRTPNPHVAFGGGGPHLCLGLHVARIETAAMLRELLTRMPDLEPTEPPELLASSFIAGVKRMPVRFTPTAPVRAG